jgi:hypothetical protein
MIASQFTKNSSAMIEQLQQYPHGKKIMENLKW